MSRIWSRIIAVLTVAFACSALASADVPPPGAHGVVKRFANVSATIENFSPLQFDARPTALTSDRRGGVWFGLGNTLEHIDRAGRVTSVTLPWLWDIGGMSYDGRGRLWFSLVQSGRIGTLVDGQLVTRVVVARHNFPDLRSIAFDRYDALWFIDWGRRSIGRRAADGGVTERPLRDGDYPDSLALCGKRAYVAAYGEPYGGGEILSTGIDLNASPVEAWKGDGRPSVACDHGTRLKFAYSDDARLFAAADSGVLSLQPQRALSENEHVRLERFGDDRSFELTLPFEDVSTVTQTEDGTIWIGLWEPQSIVRIRLDPEAKAR